MDTLGRRRLRAAEAQVLHQLEQAFVVIGLRAGRVVRLEMRLHLGDVALQIDLPVGFVQQAQGHARGSAVDVEGGGAVTARLQPLAEVGVETAIGGQPLAVGRQRRVGEPDAGFDRAAHHAPPSAAPRCARDAIAAW